LHPLSTHLECPHKNFGSDRICKGSRPLPDGEESVRISAPQFGDIKFEKFDSMLGVAQLVQKDTQGIVVRRGDVPWAGVCVCKKLSKSDEPFLRYGKKPVKPHFGLVFLAITLQSV